MFCRLLWQTTIIYSAGVCVLRIAKSHSGGKDETSATSFRRLPLVTYQIDQSKHHKGNTTSGGKFTISEMKMDYKEEADAIAQKAYNIYKSTDWKIAKASKDVKVLYKKSTEFDGHVYRAECIIDSPAEKVIQYILPSPRGLRGKWDKTVKESEVIEQISEDLIVGRSATHSVAMGLISSRDFVDLITVRRYPEESIICTNSKSIQRKDCLPKDGYVRGVNYHGGTFCIPVEGDPNKCFVVNIVQTDLSGMLPKSVVESALPTNLIEFFRDLDVALKDNNMNCQ